MGFQVLSIPAKNSRAFRAPPLPKVDAKAQKALPGGRAFCASIGEGGTGG
jgi:hypothetical protein